MFTNPAILTMAAEARRAGDLTAARRTMPSSHTRRPRPLRRVLKIVGIHYQHPVPAA